MRTAIAASFIVLASLGVAAAASAGDDAKPAATSAAAPSAPAPKPFDIHVPTSTHPVVTKSATLPDIPLGEFQKSITNDRGLMLGSIGSGLFSLGHNEYWTITDRGPNGEPNDFLRTFPVPEFQPTLVKVKVRGESVDVLDKLPLTTKSGAAVTGLPPFVRATDPKPALSDGAPSTDLIDPGGLDTEGVVATPKGFWIVDEYGPSILSVSPTGQLLTRYVPKGSEGQYQGADTRIVGNLPAELANRVANRGFEEISLLPDGHTVVVALQSPIEGQTGTLTTKLVEFDTDTADVVRTYNYRFDPPWTFQKEPGEAAKSKHLKISAMIPLSQDRILVQERTDIESRFYEVKLGTDGTLGPKRAVVNLAGVAGIPDKIEGAALKTPDTLVLTNDNDFGFFTESFYSQTEDIASNGEKTKFVEVKLQ